MSTGAGATPAGAAPSPGAGARPGLGGEGWDARDESLVPHTTVHRVVRRILEPAQDVIVVALAIVLFAVMVRTLVTVAGHAVAREVPPRVVLSEVLFMLVLIELLRLLVIYLRDHHVSVDVMVEVTIVSALREISLRGVVEIPAVQLLVLAAFLLALGFLLRFGDLRVAQQTSARRATWWTRHRPGLPASGSRHEERRARQAAGPAHGAP